MLSMLVAADVEVVQFSC